MTFAHSVDDRYFEDYVEGEVYRFGSIAVTEDEVVAFAKRYDPQSFHTDPVAAKRSPFGGLIASGWHTAGMMMRLFADHYLTHVASLASPGLDELRWLKPVRPGDTLSIRVTVLKAVASKSKPDRGVVKVHTRVYKQTGDLVAEFKRAVLVPKRDPGDADHAEGPVE
jgi:acyl dehydratase